MKLKLMAAAACGVMLLSSVAQAAEVKVLASGAVKEAALELFPQFEKASGNKVAVTWAGTVDIKKKIAAGEVFDLVIVAQPGTRRLHQGRQDRRRQQGRSGEVLGRRRGQGRRAEARSQIRRRSQEGAAGREIGRLFDRAERRLSCQSLFEKMGIADQIKAKAKVTTPGVPVASLIRSGEAEIGFQQVSELIHEAGIDFLGPIPADVQNITVFSSGVPDRSQGADRSESVAEIPDRAGGGARHQEAWLGASRRGRRRRASAMTAARYCAAAKEAAGASGSAAATGVDGGSAGCRRLGAGARGRRCP